MLNNRDASSVTDNSRQGLQILISGADPRALEQLKATCAAVAGVQVSTLRSSGTDPLAGQMVLPDVLLLRVSEHWREELGGILRRPAGERPILLVCGPLDADGMRLAMQAGARDCLPEPLDPVELQSVLARIVQERHITGRIQGRLIAVMNAKGGSGATLVACNLAHQLSLQGSVLLVDLDLQFGSVAHYLDMLPGHGLVDVLGQIGELDSLALRGFCTHYSPNLHVLGSRPGEPLSLPQDVRVEQLEQLLQLARGSYDWVVVDLPRCIDHLTGTALDHSDQVLVILQQSLSHLKDATRLLQILRDELGVPVSHLRVVINRFSKSAPVSLRDVADALHCSEPLQLPNDFAVVSESLNAGVPLGVHAPRAAITQAIQKLAASLPGQRSERARGFFSKAFNLLLGGEHHVR